MLRQKLSRFFIGRNGQDQLGIFLLFISIIFSFFRMWELSVVSWMILAIAIFRMVSKNINKRRKENIVFLKVWHSILRPFKNMKEMYNERKFYRIFRCPQCKQKLRVPKYKGKVKVRCTKCNETFIKKT